MALRLPAWCGLPTREEARQVLEVGVAAQGTFTAQALSLTRQRREVLKHPERLESLAHKADHVSIELLPSPQNWSNGQITAPISICCHDKQGPLSEASKARLSSQTQAIRDVEETACVM